MSSIAPAPSRPKLDGMESAPSRPKVVISAIPEPPSLPVVPNLFLALNDLATAKWLRIRDDEEEGAQSQMTGENINMALICALLLTVFVPLYYIEPSRMNLPDDGFTVDFKRGWLWRGGRFHLPKSVMHEIFDIGYFCAVNFSVIGTFSSVYFSLAANEAGCDANILVLRKKIGGFSVMPYMCFTIAVLGFFTPYWLQMLVVPRTVTSLIIKVASASLLASSFLLMTSLMVQGLFLGRREELCTPPVLLEEQQLVGIADEYFVSTQQADLSLKTFLNLLRGPASAVGYRPPLSFLTRVRATKLFMVRTANMLGIGVEELRHLDAVSNNLNNSSTSSY